MPSVNRMYLKSFFTNKGYLIGASFRNGRLAIINAASRSLMVNFLLPADCEYTFAVSEDGRYVATAAEYVKPSYVEIRDITSCELVACVPSYYPSKVRFSRNSQYIVYGATFGKKAGVYVCEIGSSESIQAKGAFGVNNGCLLPDGSLLMPRNSRKGAVRVTFDPVGITYVDLPGKRMAYLLSTSPTDQHITALCSNGIIANWDAQLLAIRWEACIPRIDWTTFSGDGRFVALLHNKVPSGSEVDIMVLDAATGAVVRTIDAHEQARGTLAGPWCLCVSGRFVNLETGEIDPGVSDLAWWQNLLKQ